MNVLLISHNNLFAMPRGGEKSMKEIIYYLSESGLNCSVIMRAKKDITDISKVKENTGAVKYIILNEITIEILKPVVKNLNPDIILGWGMYAEYSFIISKMLKIHFIIFVRSWSVFSRYKYHMNYCKKAAFCIVNCELAKKRMEQNGIGSIVSLVPVDTENLINKIDDKILLIGLEKINKLDIELPEIMPDNDFLIIDYNFSKYRKKNNVEHYPYQENLNNIWPLVSIHLFPLPAGGIGTGRTTIEAQFKGVPVIAEKGCGAEEIGTYILNKPDPEKWKAAINEVLKDYENYHNKALRNVYNNYNKINELEKIRTAIIQAAGYRRGRALVYLSDGIGNTIESSPALRAINAMGYKIDAVTNFSSAGGMEYIKSLSFIKPVEINKINKNKYSFFYSFNRNVSIGESTIYPEFNKTIHEKDWHLNALYKNGYNAARPRPFIVKSNKYYSCSNNAVIFAAGCFNERWKIKQWQYFDKLAVYFENVILLGSESDVLPEYNWPDNVLNLIGKLDLLDSFSAIAQAAAFIGNDTGLAHAAAALKKTTFVIFGSTSHVKNLPAGAIRISKTPPYDCQPCQYRQSENEAGEFMNCRSYFKCLKNLSPIEVYKKIKRYVINEKPELNIIFKKGV